MRAPRGPERCPKCDAESPCTDWNEVDIGVGVQTFNHSYTCPVHGIFAWDESAPYVPGKRSVAIFQRDDTPEAP